MSVTNGPPRGTSRVLQKLHDSLDRKEFYEAHQMYRTLYFRYLAQNKHSELLELLFDGATRFLERGQISSGTDLALLFSESLVQCKPNLSENILLKLEQLLAKLPNPAPQSHCGTRSDSSHGQKGLERGGSLTDSANAVNAESRVKFMDASLRWSGSLPEGRKYRQTGHPSVHQKFASVYWSEKNFIQARYHFMLSEDGEGCATFLIEYQTTCGYSNEVDLFVAQAVLQYLCHAKQQTANVCFCQYTLNHPDIAENGPPFGLPLLNFLWLLLLSIDIGKVQHFTVLLEQYQPAIQRDSSYMQYLDKIGQVFFGLPPPKKQKSPGGGGIMNMIKGLFGEEDNDQMEEEDEEFQSIPSSPTPPFSSSLNENTVPATSSTTVTNGALPRGRGETGGKQMAVEELD